MWASDLLLHSHLYDDTNLEKHPLETYCVTCKILILRHTLADFHWCNCISMGPTSLSAAGSFHRSQLQGYAPSCILQVAQSSARCLLRAFQIHWPWPKIRSHAILLEKMNQMHDEVHRQFHQNGVPDHSQDYPREVCSVF